MIRDRQPGEFFYGDTAIWSATGQEVTVVEAWDKHVVKVVCQGATKFVPRRHLTLRVKASENLEFYDDWFEADQL